MDVAAYLEQYLVTNDAKVIGNIPNFLEIAIGRVNKRLKSAFLEIQSDALTLSPDLVAIKWLTVNGELYSPSLTARDATYSVQAGALSITPALISTDVLAYVYYAVNQSILSQSSPAILIHGAAAEALIFEGNTEGAAAETALFNQDLDEALGWETNGGITLGGQGIPGDMVTPTSTGGGGSSITLSNTTPLVETGSGAPGTANTASRGDHVHPASGPAMATTLPLVESGTGAVGTSAAAARADHVHPAQTGTVVGPASSIANYVPAWVDASGSLLKNGYPVQANATDATAAALLSVGAFGLGGLGAPYSSDLNALPRTGFYSYQSTSLNIPPMGGLGTVCHQMLDGSGDDWSQIAIEITGGTVGLAFRTATNGVIGAWVQLLSTTDNAASATYSKQVPRRDSAAAFTTADNGKCRILTTTTAQIPPSTFTAGDTFSIFNATGSPATLTAGAGVGLILAGANTPGTRTLAINAIATLWCYDPLNFIVSGAGVT
jgi:hypothetical protein